MSAATSGTERWAERCSFLVVSSAIHRSTRLSQEEPAEMTCRVNRGCRTSHR